MSWLTADFESVSGLHPAQFEIRTIESVLTSHRKSIARIGRCIRGLVVAARDEVKSDQLLLTAEINRRDARNSKQRQKLLDDIDDRRSTCM